MLVNGIKIINDSTWLAIKNDEVYKFTILGVWEAEWWKNRNVDIIKSPGNVQMQ